MDLRQQNTRKPSHRRDATRAAVAEELAKGTPPALIARALGVSRTTVYRWLAEDEQLQAARDRMYADLPARFNEVKAAAEAARERRNEELLPQRQAHIKDVAVQLRTARSLRGAEQTAIAMERYARQVRGEL